MNELSPTKQALLALKQMQSKLDALEKAKNEPIAIIGLGCRFPGANNPEAFREILQQKKDTITEIPRQHWDIEQYYHSDINIPGKICTRYAGIIPHLQEFDAQFFRISPREAASLDPQQRLLLEVTWEALENAAISPEKLQGSQTGVFIGICGIDYWYRLLSRKITDIDAYLTTGNSHSLASGRLSYFLGLTGASISLDTACSSSLVAIHLAINSLRNRECEMAIVGGVNRLISPEISINFSKAKMLAPDGRCKTFDASADGFVRSEGCGVVILKRLSDAVANNDNISAILLGSAVNQDGRTSGITAPSSISQESVICQALNNSKIEPNQINYIETHGTGTALGDLIEIEALSRIFTNKTHPQRDLVLGAVKTNIGHTEAAAGIASLIKVILSLKYQEIYPNLHLKHPNPEVNWQNLPFILPNQSIPWIKGEKPRIAGVSAFGFNGTNAHVIISEFNQENLIKNRDNQSEKRLFTLSARNEKALQELAKNYINYLQLNPDLDLEDICFTVNTGRSHFNHRLAIIAESTANLQQKLNQWLNNQTLEEIYYGKVTTIRESQSAKELDLTHLAQLYVNGVNLDWSDFKYEQLPRKISLPTYPFQRQKFWLE